MSTSPLRLGFVGAGAIGRVHMSIFQQLAERATLGAVCDVSLELATERAKEFGIDRVHESSDQLLADPAIDAVVLGVPNKYHAPMAIQALEAGKHVLLEKPMGINGDAARTIVAAQEKSGKILMVGHQMRWQWLSQEIKRLVDKGELGDIYFAKAYWWRRQGIPGWGSWFTRFSESGGGPLADIGVHMMDVAIWMMGNPKPVSVFGSTYSEFGPHKKGIGGWGTPNWEGHYDVEDLASAMIKMENGATLTLEASWAANVSIQPEVGVHLMGTEGGAAWHMNTGKLTTEKFGRPVDLDLVTPENAENPRLALSTHFLDCVRDGSQPITSAASGLVNNQIIDAIYASAKSGTSIDL